MSNMIRVVFEPYSPTHTKVTATYSDGSLSVTYLDNVSAKTFLTNALMAGSMVPPMGNFS